MSRSKRLIGAADPAPSLRAQAQCLTVRVIRSPDSLRIRRVAYIVRLFCVCLAEFHEGLPELSNFCCLPGSAGGSPDGTSRRRQVHGWGASGPVGFLAR